MKLTGSSTEKIKFTNVKKVSLRLNNRIHRLDSFPGI